HGASAPRRPQRSESMAQLHAALEAALKRRDGLAGAECIHELWMRGEMGLNLERALERLWRAAAGSVPEWLPMRYIEWLPRVYAIAARCGSESRGRSNIYLVLLDYPDSERGPHGIYVGMSEYSAAERFDQHKAGIRAA